MTSQDSLRKGQGVTVRNHRCVDHVQAKCELHTVNRKSAWVKHGFIQKFKFCHLFSLMLTDFLLWKMITAITCLFWVNYSCPRQP